MRKKGKTGGGEEGTPASQDGKSGGEERVSAPQDRKSDREDLTAQISRVRIWLGGKSGEGLEPLARRVGTGVPQVRELVRLMEEHPGWDDGQILTWIKRREEEEKRRAAEAPSRKSPYGEKLVAIPRDPRISRKKVGKAYYVYYTYAREYRPDKQYSVGKTSVIGRVSPEFPDEMYPNEKFYQYFPDVERPADDRAGPTPLSRAQFKRDQVSRLLAVCQDLYRDLEDFVKEYQEELPDNFRMPEVPDQWKQP